MSPVHDVAAAEVLARAEHAAGREHSLSPNLLNGFLPSVLAVAATARRLTEEEVASCQRLGGVAAQEGHPLPAVVDLYLTATRQLWPQLLELVGRARGRTVPATELVDIGGWVLRAVDEALAAVAAGYVQAQRLVVRREEGLRREFLAALFSGQAEAGSLIERAEAFGLQLAAAHVVVVAQTGRPVGDEGRVIDWVQEAVQARFGRRAILVSGLDGRLVCVVPAGLVGAATEQDGAAPDRNGQVLGELVGRAAGELARTESWRAGLGRPHAGPRGVFRSYQEALAAVDVAQRLGLTDRVVSARQLLVYRVLLRDATALAELVQAVLEPMAAARGGAGPLMETLDAYFASGGNAAQAARQLQLSVRAVTYRLDRVRSLTGYTPADPAHRLPLQVAVMGARLLDWPQKPLPTE